MPCVAFHPLPGNLVLRGKAVEFLPQVFVFHGLFGGGFPAVFLPAVYPAFHAVFHILRIGADDDGAGAGECGKPLDDGGEFHAVVGGVRFAAEQFFFAAAVAQNRAPTACAGVAFACAVCV